MLYQLSYTRSTHTRSAVPLSCPTALPSYRLTALNGGGRIRTCVGLSPADLQSAAINHSATPPIPAELQPQSPEAAPAGADGGTRTPNLLITNQLLYQIELRQQPNNVKMALPKS